MGCGRRTSLKRRGQRGQTRPEFREPRGRCFLFPTFPKIVSAYGRAGRGLPQSHCLVPWAEALGRALPATQSTRSRVFPVERGHAVRRGQRFRYTPGKVFGPQNFPKTWPPSGRSGRGQPHSDCPVSGPGYQRSASDQRGSAGRCVAIGHRESPLAGECLWAESLPRLPHIPASAVEQLLLYAHTSRSSLQSSRPMHLNRSLEVCETLVIGVKTSHIGAASGHFITGSGTG
jgi:hypothetical protein